MVNFFYLDKNPHKCAKYYCDKHIVKIPVEIAQILSKIHHVLQTKINFDKIYKNSNVVKETLGPYVWSISSLENYIWTCNLGLELIKEYKYRFNKSTHKTENVLIYLLENPPIISKKETTPFIMTNKFDMFQYVSTNPVLNSRYNYAEMKCFSDNWTKRIKPKWFINIKNKIDENKKKIKSEIETRVKITLPALSQKYKLTVYRYHSFLRISYDCLFQGKWDIKAKLMNNYDSSQPLLHQLTFPQLYFLNIITKSLLNVDVLKKLNIESLKYRKKQQYKNTMTKEEWIKKNPYNSTQTIYIFK